MISEQGIQLIKSFEGIVLHPYKDQVGRATIGYGSTSYDNGKPVTMQDENITPDRAEQLLRYGVNGKAFVLAQNLKKYNINLNQNRFDSLCSFSYNVGIEGLLSSTLFEKVKANQDDPTIRTEFMKWTHGHINGKLVVLTDLTRRRKKEADLYFTP